MAASVRAAGESSNWQQLAGAQQPRVSSARGAPSAAHGNRSSHQQHGDPRAEPGVICVLANFLGCGCFRRRRERDARATTARSPRASATRTQPEVRTRIEGAPHFIPGGHSQGSCGSNNEQEDERSNLLPKGKGKGLDSSFSTSPELPPPSIPKGFQMMEESDRDADVCPTCLEGYDSDNPMIMTQCKHHFHLACIFEWLERSQLCPVCSTVMRNADGQKFLEL
mmetsp:Transcript_18001/g.32051  ORF Transcript_18001/g.32051 Transcript_18001/m.32051 type:complete len:224 (-) Transcript_18001:366-1037(-)